VDTVRRAALTAFLCVLALAGTAFAAALTESYSTLVHQIDTGQVTIAYVNEETHHVQANLKDGSQQLVAFPAAQHKAMVDSLLHHGATVIYTRKKATHHAAAAKPAHHVLRYIAAGVVAVLLLIGLGVWRYTRGGPRASQPATPSAE
jgi:hypothetical protein